MQSIGDKEVELATDSPRYDHSDLPQKLKRIFLSPPHMGGEEMRFIKDAFDSNYVAPLGPMVDAFEREFAEEVGIPYAVALSSGTAAMHLALRVLGVGPGDEVVVSSLTFIGSVSPVVFQGATPVFIDSDRISWNMDPDLLSEELEASTERGKLPKVVVPTDLYGQCADYDLILKICAPYGIPVIADSAEALGATYKAQSSRLKAHSQWKHAGFGTKAAIFSFNGNKIITTSGGGMLVSHDEALIEDAKFLSQQARDPAHHYEHSQIGHNYRMSNIIAAIGRGQLRVLDERVKKKREIFDYYQKALDDVPGIEFMPEATYGRSNRWLTVILITPDEFGADRETVRLALAAQNIESRPVWKPMHIQPVFELVTPEEYATHSTPVRSRRPTGQADPPRYDHSDLQGRRGRTQTFPYAFACGGKECRRYAGNSGKRVRARLVGGEVAEDLFNRGLCLPSGTAMTEEDLDRVTSVILSCRK